MHLLVDPTRLVEHDKRVLTLFPWRITINISQCTSGLIVCSREYLSGENLPLSTLLLLARLRLFSESGTTLVTIKCQHSWLFLCLQLRDMPGGIQVNSGQYPTNFSNS